MQFFVTRTGLANFDVARAWGLAMLLNVLTNDEVRIRDFGWAFIVEPLNHIPNNARLESLLNWRTIFAAENVQRMTRQVFITQRGNQEELKKKVKETLERQWKSLLEDLKRPENWIQIGRGETLPGSLEPSAFKGLRHITKASYTEGQLRVPEEHWALACLGMATCGTYQFSREAGQIKFFALLPIPQDIRFNDFLEVKDLMRYSRVPYRGVQNAAAHYAVQLAEHLRRRTAAYGSLRDRFSAILYFTLFGAGQQIKPSQGSQLNLAPLMEAIQKDPHGTEAMLKWLDYCFRLGATEGAEDLALAATELVMHWSLEAFEGLIRVFARLIASKKVKYENLPDEKTLLGVMKNVAT